MLKTNVRGVAQESSVQSKVMHVDVQGQPEGGTIYRASAGRYSLLRIASKMNFTAAPFDEIF